MFGRSRRARGNPARSQRGGRCEEEEEEVPQPPAVPPVALYPHIVFLDAPQRVNIFRLQRHPFPAFRFIDRVLMQKLAIDEDMTALFAGTGIPIFYGMVELTYRDLTLEFLSIYNFDDTNSQVNFRLLNFNYPMSLTEFANHLGLFFEGGGVPRNLNLMHIWFVMTEATEAGTSTSRVGMIHDLRLRMWVKSFVHTLFGRNNTDRVNSTILTMLSAHLNVDRRPNLFHPNVPWLVDIHFGRVVADKNVKSVGIGGVVTFFAKSVTGFNSSNGVEPGVCSLIRRRLHGKDQVMGKAEGEGFTMALEERGAH